MKIDLTKLNSNVETNILVNFTYSFSEEQLSSTEIIKLDDVKVNGEITKDSLDEIHLNITVKGTMVLPCAITLNPVNCPFTIKIDGNVEDLTEEIDENIKNEVNSLDILPIIWENILMEIPMRVVSEDAHLSNLEGDGWKVITEEDDGEINPELAKLKDLL